MNPPSTYCQITTACNMSCDHCLYDCKSEGDYMELDTFKNALRWHKGNLFNIGGGEPTLHPNLFAFIDMALSKKIRVWMTINGKITDLALNLAYMTEQIPDFDCKLSQDKWHDPIDEKVVNAFRRLDKVSYFRGVPIVSGRWKEGSRKTCANSNKPFITPDGNVYQCGCKGARTVGDVFDGFYPIDGKWKCDLGLPHEQGMKTKTFKGVDYGIVVKQEKELTERISIDI